MPRLPRMVQDRVLTALQPLAMSEKPSHTRRAKRLPAPHLCNRLADGSAEEHLPACRLLTGQAKAGAPPARRQGDSRHLTKGF